jgi:hypothetical protein
LVAIAGCETTTSDRDFLVAGVRNPGVVIVFADVSEKGARSKYCPIGVLATDDECSKFTGVTGADRVCRWPGDNTDVTKPKNIHWKSIAFDRRGKKPDFKIDFTGSLHPCKGDDTGSGHNQTCKPKNTADLDFPTDPDQHREFKYTITGDDCDDQPLDPYIVFRR